MLLIVADIVSINVSLLLFYLVKYRLGILAHESVMEVEYLFAPMAWISAFWVFLFAIFGLYEKFLDAPFRRRLVSIIGAIFIGGVLFLLLNFERGEGFEISISSMLVFLVFLLISEIILRSIIYIYFSWSRRKSEGKLNAVVISPSGSEMDKRLRDDLFTYYNIVGYVGKKSDSTLPWLGKLGDLSDILRSKRTARMILDIDEFDYRDLKGIFGAAYYMETVVLAGADSADNLRGLKRHDTVHQGYDIISIRHRRLFPVMLRRAIDAGVSIFAIILILPFWAFKMAVSGRIGGRKTECSEFVVQDEKKIAIKHFMGDVNSGRPGNLWAMLAVLKGQISLYGVTVVHGDEYENSRESIDGYWRKFLVKPGLFGPGYSSDEPQERFDLDLAYLEKTSIIADLVLILRQIFGIPLIKRGSS
jgi:hypothetical protein